MTLRVSLSLGSARNDHPSRNISPLNNLSVSDLASPNQVCSFSSNNSPCLLILSSLPVLFSTKSPWPAWFLCFRSGSRSSCPVEWTGWWGFVACFSAMFWPCPSRFGDAISVLLLHLIDASSCSVHLRQLLPIPGFVRLMVRNKLVAVVVLQTSPPPSSFDLHSPRPRVAVRVRRRSSAVSPFGWWQPGSRLAGGKPPPGQLRWCLEASLDATEEEKTDACCCLQRWMHVSPESYVILWFSLVVSPLGTSLSLNCIVR